MAVRIGLGIMLAIVAAPLVAKPAAQRTPVLEAVTRCRQITDNAERLACFDASVAKLDEAEAKRDVVIVDREQVKATRRSLFGLALPSFNLFSGHEDAKDVVTQIDAKVANVVANGDGSLVVTLEDGAHWRQTDATLLPRTPRAGDQVTIKRAAMGSYQMYVRGIAIRVKREN